MSSEDNHYLELTKTLSQLTLNQILYHELKRKNIKIDDNNDLNMLKSLSLMDSLCQYMYYGYIPASAVYFYKTTQVKNWKFIRLHNKITGYLPTIIYYSLNILGAYYIKGLCQKGIQYKFLDTLSKYDDSLLILRYQDHICQL